jgi:hypothetical protein
MDNPFFTNPSRFLAAWTKIDALLKRFELRNPPLPIILSLIDWRQSLNYRITIQLKLESADRDSGFPSKFQIDEVLSVEEIEHFPDEYWFEYFRSFIHRAVLHEMDESMHVDKVRVWDPHKGEKV